MIEIAGLEKSFDGQQVLRGVDLTIPDREIVAVIGKSGGGKSVLMKLVIGLLKPDSGSILINGTDITGLSERNLDRIRNNLGVLFQGGALFDSMTLFENVSFPLREKTKLGRNEVLRRALAGLDDVGLSGMGDKYPAEVSGGMKKRAALARALVTEPSIVLFDEPTTGLDPVILTSIHNLIRTLHRKYGFTGVVISHEIPEIFSISDKVAMLHDGKIVQAGTPDEIQNSDLPVVRQFITGSPEGPIKILS